MMRTLALSGAAALALSAFVTSASAGESTPAEIMATNQLNDQQIAMAHGTISDNTTIGSSGKTNIEERTLPVSGAAITTAAQTSNTATPNRTETMTMADSSASAAATGPSIAAAPISQPANGVANPAKTFATSSVIAADGQTVGAVQKIMLDSSGRARSVNVALLDNMGQSKTVTLDASALNYDPGKNVLVAQMTNDQIKALPAEPQG
jgi:hypothetical protein